MDTDEYRKNLAFYIHDNPRKGGEAATAESHAYSDARQWLYEDAASDLFDPEMDVGYEQSGDMVCGVELQAGNQIIAWSLSHYLDELEANTLALLARDETAEPESA